MDGKTLLPKAAATAAPASPGQPAAKKPDQIPTRKKK
jgi:hypothetical protein